MTKMKLLFGGLVISAFALIGSSLSAMGDCASQVLPDPSNENKATLCHFTGSEDNPFVINEVAAAAVDSHADHHGDCWRFDGGPTICVP